MCKVVVRLLGGLGNQLFCYAMAKRFALKRGLLLKLDTRSGFVRDPFHRQYMLSLFQIGGCSEASSWESFLEPAGRIRRKCVRDLSNWIPIELRPYLQQEALFAKGQSGAFFDREGRGVGDLLLRYQPHGSVYLEGYWQDARLFQDVSCDLRRELSPCFPLGSDLLARADEFRTVQSVCVHVRAFQELSNQEVKLANSGRGLVGSNYYEKAIRYVAEHVSNPVFYCFTEVPDYARSVLPRSVKIEMIRPPRAVDRRYVDVSEFYLMSQCRHFISAQSTFMWWASYLSPYEDKTIIVPDDAIWNGNLGYKPSGFVTIKNAYN